MICKLDKLNCPVVSIQCMLCSKIYQLYRKGEYYDNDTMMLSNWTKHIKRCYDEAKTQRNSGKQTSLTTLVPKPKSANNSDKSDPIINLDDDTCLQSDDMCYQYEHSMQHFWKPPPMQVIQEGGP